MTNNTPLKDLLPELPCDLRWRLADQEVYQRQDGTRTLYLEKKVVTQKSRLFSSKVDTVVTWEEVDHQPWTEKEGLGTKTRTWDYSEGLYQIALYILWKVERDANKPPVEHIPSGVTRES